MSKYYKIKVKREGYYEYILKADCKKDADAIAQEEFDWAEEKMDYDTDVTVKAIKKPSGKFEDRVYTPNFFGFMSTCKVD